MGIDWKLGVIETNCIISKLLVYHIEMRHFICPYKILVAMQVKHIHDLHPPLSLSLYKLLDVASMQVPPEQVKGLCIYDVVWLHGAGTSPDSTSPYLHLNATLRWDYPPELVRHFRVYWRRLRGPVPQVPEGQLTLVGRAYSNLFRITELAVPEPPSVLELVVEPVTREGFLVPESHWGRRRFSYKEEAQ